MWNTKRWLLRALLLTVAVSGILLTFQYNAKEAAQTRYQQNMGYSQNKETKELKKSTTRKTKRNQASVQVDTKKSAITPWFVILGGVAIFSLLLSAIVQQWGWSPIVKTVSFVLVIGIILTLLGAKIESDQRNKYE